MILPSLWRFPPCPDNVNCDAKQNIHQENAALPDAFQYLLNETYKYPVHTILS